MTKLRERMSEVDPLPHEDFFTRTDTCETDELTASVVLICNFFKFS